MRFLWLSLIAILLAGCHMDMWVQPKVLPQEKSDFFVDDMGSRKRLASTQQFSSTGVDSELTTYMGNGKLVETIPVPLTKDLLERGREQFQIFCRNCHGAAGDGQGMIAKRGLTLARPVASYHTDRLRQMPIGHFYDVMTNGFGVMFPFRDRIEPRDRWAIASYIRVLQRSQNVPATELTPQELAQMDATTNQGSGSQGASH